MKRFTMTEGEYEAHQRRVKGQAPIEVEAAPVIERPRVNNYKADFLNQLHLAGLPEPQAELRFAPPRLWRFDWAYEDRKVAIEYQGGNYTGKGGHNTVKGLKNDYEKFTEAALRGWMLILIDSGSVRDGRALDWTIRALTARMKGVAP